MFGPEEDHQGPLSHFRILIFFDNFSQNGEGFILVHAHESIQGNELHFELRVFLFLQTHTTFNSLKDSSCHTADNTTFNSFNDSSSHGAVDVVFVFVQSFLVEFFGQLDPEALGIVYPGAFLVVID